MRGILPPAFGFIVRCLTTTEISIFGMISVIGIPLFIIGLLLFIRGLY